MEQLKLTYPSGSKEDYLKELFVHQEEAFNLQFGTVFLKVGTVIPEEGYTRHDQKKIVFIVKGEVRVVLGDNPHFDQIIIEVDTFMVDYFEAHKGIVLKDTKLIYVLFGKKENSC